VNSIMNHRVPLNAANYFFDYVSNYKLRRKSRVSWSYVVIDIEGKIPYRTVNALSFAFKNQSVNAV
jgi:hypothetical protein